MVKLNNTGQINQPTDIRPPLIAIISIAVYGSTQSVISAILFCIFLVIIFYCLHIAIHRFHHNTPKQKTQKS